MAVFNEMQVGRFNRALQKITGVKGGPPVRTLGTEILPVFPLFWGAETRYLESWQKFATTITTAAVAAQSAIANFRNPLGSNIIVIFERISFFCLNGQTPFQPAIWGPAPQTAAQDQASVIATQTRFDARGQQSTNMVLTIGNNAVVSWGTASQWFNGFDGAGTGTVAEAITTDTHEFPLLPGDGIRVVATTANAALTANIMWRERFLEDSERT